MVPSTSLDWELVANEAVLPVQFYELYSEPETRSPEVMLVLALMQDALRCYLGTSTLGRGCQRGSNYEAWSRSRRADLRDEAKCWILGEYPLDGRITFSDACGVLGFDPDRLRQDIERRDPLQPLLTTKNRVDHRFLKIALPRTRAKKTSKLIFEKGVN
jgi:hypothetical protein